MEIALTLPNGDAFAPTILHMVARAKFRLGDTAGADEALQTARRIIDRLDDERSLGTRIALRSERVGVLATMDRWDDVRREIETAGVVPPGFYRGAAFSGFVQQLLSAGNTGQAAAAEHMLRWRDDLEPGPDTDAALAVAVHILGAGGSTDEALALAAQVIERETGLLWQERPEPGQHAGHPGAPQSRRRRVHSGGKPLPERRAQVRRSCRGS